MNLDEAQKQKVAAWVAEGLKLSDIQKRLADSGLTLTYMEVRFLVDDLRLTPKDADRVKPVEIAQQGPGPAASSPSAPPASKPISPLAPEPEPAPGGVTVRVDQITRPGAVASGNVRFTDGNSADWYLDQMGRLGLLPKTPGYRPSQADVMAFQAELQNELGRLGL